MVKLRKDANISDRDISGQLHHDRRANKSSKPKVKRNLELTLHTKTTDLPAPTHNEMRHHAPSDRKPHEHFEHVEDMRHRVTPMKVTDYELEHPTVNTVRWKQAPGGGITHTQERGESLIGAGFDRRPPRHVFSNEENEMISAGGVVDHETKLPTYNSPEVR
jgi:hypothetical protein